MLLAAAPLNYLTTLFWQQRNLPKLSLFPLKTIQFFLKQNKRKLEKYQPEKSFIFDIFPRHICLQHHYYI
jgi:hypothetical protein